MSVSIEKKTTMMKKTEKNLEYQNEINHKIALDECVFILSYFANCKLWDCPSFQESPQNVRVFS